MIWRSPYCSNSEREALLGEWVSGGCGDGTDIPAKKGANGLG